MKYILSEKEFSKLSQLKHDYKKELKDKLQKVCTDYCNSVPILFWGNSEPKIWGCILNESDSGVLIHGYCDECPVKDECPFKHKEWSK